VLTKNKLLDLWKENDFKPKKRFGQNFLIDKNVKNNIIKSVNPGRKDCILEIGPGFGELTEDLAAKAKSLTVVEKDRVIAGFLRGYLLKEHKNINVVLCDFLDFQIRPGFSKVVGNLPYYVTTPIIERILSASDKIKQAFIMVQKEYADRVTALPGSKAYSSLTCMVQAKADVCQVMTVSKTCFLPQPKVDSVFLKLRIHENPKIKVRDRNLFERIIRMSFQQAFTIQAGFY